MRPRGLVISAPSSGAGKTTVTLGLLRAFRRRGVAVGSAKTGPDYIDPAFHAAATGGACVTLDPWCADADQLRARAMAATGELLVVEGAMGLFDGAPARHTPLGQGSTADAAAALGLPVGSAPASPLFWSQAVTVESAFASATVVFSTAGLSFRQRLYLGILSELALSSHILAPGADAAAAEPAVTTPYTALVSAVSAATTNCSVTVGGGGGTGAVADDTLVVYYVAEAGRFADATKAVLHALFASSVTADRLVAVAKNELSDTTETLRDGGSVAYAVARAVAEVRLLVGGGGGGRAPDRSHLVL